MFWQLEKSKEVAPALARILCLEHPAKLAHQVKSQTGGISFMIQNSRVNEEKLLGREKLRRYQAA